MLRVDLGGVGQGGEWVTVNTDTSGYRPQPDIVADITATANALGAHLTPATVDVMRCVHTLEHLPAYEIMPSLRYWKTFIRPGGTLLIVVPDCGAILEDYCEAHIPFEVVASLFYVSGFRTVQGAGEEHRWGFSEETLTQAFNVAGYKNIRCAGNEWFPSHWVFDYPDMIHTGCVGTYKVPNLRMIGEA